MDPKDIQEMIALRKSQLISDEEISKEIVAKGWIDLDEVELFWPSPHIIFKPLGEELASGPSIYTNQGRKSWYGGPEHGPRWNALKNQWQEGRLAGQVETLNSLDQASSDIVSLLSDPRGESEFENRFSDRGLVIGYVQSGKTTSFTAVAAKAADAGYKIVIILSGLTDNLRRQTQIRMDEDLRTDKWIPLTNRGIEVENNGEIKIVGGDFVRPAVPIDKFASASPLTAFAVVKKNVRRLRSLYKWLVSQNGAFADLPILVIDDEADQGSIDTSPAKDFEKRTAINEAILRILSLPRVSYLGYTATPFANLLIDPRFQTDIKAQGLFPRDFIYALPEPSSSYFGTKTIFGYCPPNLAFDDSPIADANVIRIIPASETSLYSRKQTPGNPQAIGTEVAPVLGTSIRWFLLAAAARKVRGQSHRHTTMLVHTSQYIINHQEMSKLLQNYVGHLQDGDRVTLLDELRQLWIREKGSSPLGEGFNPEGIVIETFETLVPAINEILDNKEMSVVIDNAKSENRLDYPPESVGKNGRLQIVVGGNTLSRGLTLEGLVSTYFCRAANTYDTMLQMARWFGYRVGYADLPRVWMSQETKVLFEHLAEVEEDLRQSIRKLQMDSTLTPLDAVIKIRSHPKILVSARNKIQGAVVVHSDFSDSAHQTTHFAINQKAEIDNNWNAADKLFSSIRSQQAVEIDDRGRRIFIDVDQSSILNFLKSYKFREIWAEDSNELVAYIERESNTGPGLRWNVALIGSVDVGEEVKLGGYMTRTLNRTRRVPAQPLPEVDVADLIAIKNSSRDEFVDLTIGRKASADVGDLRNERDESRTALLVVYPISKSSDRDTSRAIGRYERIGLDADGNLIGFLITFPSSVASHAKDYVMLDPNLKDSDIETELDDEEEETDRDE